VWAWGQPLCDFNNVQQRQPSPVLLPTSSQVVKVASGAFHNLALQANGQVLAWGRNEYGSLGLGDTVFMSNPTAINYFVDHAVKVMDITCGGWHTAAITTEGDMYVWGRGEHGRLGLGDERGASKLLPTLLELPDGERVKQVSCGGSHTLFLTTSRKVG
jgi:alpha-tubulin suppressor-like RCC1 family protein